MSEPDLKTAMITAIGELTTAQTALRECESRATEARHVETDARNRANKAQARVDTLMAEMRKHAPQSTDWRLRSSRVEAA